MNLSVSDIQDQADKHPMISLRGKAIDVHLSLEQTLCRLFQGLLEIPNPEAAGVAFFAIRNSRSIKEIIKKTWKIKFAAEFSLFGGSIATHIQSLTETRNQIAHWLPVGVVENSAYSDDVLKPPNIYASGWWEANPKLDVSDVLDFINKCDSITRILNMFVLFHLTPHVGVDMPPEWHDIFQQPIHYPLEQGHPLLAKPSTEQDS